VRYADDIVAGFEHEADARRFWDAMRTRFEQFTLELHEEKTRLLEFGRHAAVRRQRRGLGKPETFTFLGSRSSAASLGAGRSSSNARHEETACERRFGNSRCN